MVAVAVADRDNEVEGVTLTVELTLMVAVAVVDRDNDVDRVALTVELTLMLAVAVLVGLPQHNHAPHIQSHGNTMHVRSTGDFSHPVGDLELLPGAC
jgi:hypothetical protein